MKRGFTLIELLIAITLLTTIILVVTSVYTAAVRDYPISYAKSQMNSQLASAIDGLSLNIKMAYNLPTSKVLGGTTYTRSSNLLILELPAQNADGTFIYNGNTFQTDTLIYSISGGNLTRQIFGYSGGQKNGEVGTSKTLLRNVANTSSFSTGSNITVTTVINLSRSVSNRTVTVSNNTTANLRNRP